MQDLSADLCDSSPVKKNLARFHVRKTEFSRYYACPKICIASPRGAEEWLELSLVEGVGVRRRRAHRTSRRS